MTTITVKLTKPKTTVYFNPPLPRRNKMQIVGYYDFSEQIAVSCDIVEPTSLYTNYVQNKLGPSQLLGIVPSKKYPWVKVRKSQDSISSMKFSLVDKKGNPPKVDESAPHSICLRIYN